MSTFECSYRRLGFLLDFQSLVLECLYELQATEGLVNGDYSFLLHDSLLSFLENNGNVL